MAKTNQIIENRTYGDKITFLVTAEDSGNQFLRAELYVHPGGDGPPEHYHPLQSETFEVIKGQLNLIVDGEKMLLKPGERITVPPNALHKWWNAGDEELVAVGELRPALKTEFFLETMYALDEMGKMNKKGLPSFLQFAAILNEYYGELFVVGPPIIVQKIIAKFVGRFAKWMGYRGYVPYPKKSFKMSQDTETRNGIVVSTH
jgi:quercetin dioxygenase-like cupin family protein